MTTRVMASVGGRSWIRAFVKLSEVFVRLAQPGRQRLTHCAQPVDDRLAGPFRIVMRQVVSRPWMLGVCGLPSSRYAGGADGIDQPVFLR
jgi:hypothetical protein